MAKTAITMKTLKSPKRPTLTDSQAKWDKYEKDLKEYQTKSAAQKKEKERRSKLGAKKK